MPTVATTLTWTMGHVLNVEMQTHHKEMMDVDMCIRDEHGVTKRKGSFRTPVVQLNMLAAVPGVYTMELSHQGTLLYEGQFSKC
jgi:hypothetical protein